MHLCPSATPGYLRSSSTAIGCKPTKRARGWSSTAATDDSCRLGCSVCRALPLWPAAARWRETLSEVVCENSWGHVSRRWPVAPGPSPCFEQRHVERGEPRARQASAGRPSARCVRRSLQSADLASLNTQNWVLHVKCPSRLNGYARRVRKVSASRMVNSGMGASVIGRASDS